MRIVILDGDTVSHNDMDWSFFNSLGDVSFYGFTSKDEVVDKISDAEIVFCNKSLITEEVLEKCKNVKYIGLFATGYNNVDLESAKRHNVTVCNVPSYSTNAVAQHIFALILGFYNHIYEYGKSVADGNWIHSKLFSYFDIPIFELAGQTIGIVGFGSIGRKVAEIAKAFSMNVLVFTRTIPENTDGIEFVEFDELLKRSDIVTLHCPLTKETKGLINSKKLALMKKSAILINTSRGPVINEQDLKDALNNEVIAGAGLDVVEVEPMIEANPLCNAKNCVITPHIAWAPLQTRKRLVKIVYENYKAWIDGNPQNAVQ